MISKTAVLFRIQHLQQRSRRIAADIGGHFIDFIQKNNRIIGLKTCHFRNEFTWQRTEIGSAVTAYFSLVPYTAETDPHIIPAHSLGYGFYKRGLTHSRCTYQTENPSFYRTATVLHGQIFHNLILDLLQSVVMAVHNLLHTIEIDARSLLREPRQFDNPLHIIARNKRFR